MSTLPLYLTKVKVPPVKCQGIKTKLVPFILSNITWRQEEKGARWIEPFVGSGVVALNLAPRRALLADTNKHIISLYKAIQVGDINSNVVREFLQKEGKKLSDRGADYYYEVRDRFNAAGSPLDFLFLNRSCFNGVMRFNRHGKFNVPFGHKPQRFSKSYVTKIANQIDWAAKQMKGKDWEFRVAGWESTLLTVQPSDFVYMDPPYIGRHADYYNSWTPADADMLATTAKELPCGYALSMWLQNEHRRNPHLEEHWSTLDVRVYRHFYHVGATESLRKVMDEALIIKDGFATTVREREAAQLRANQQPTLPL